MQTNPVVYALIRTKYRPLEFQRCLNSALAAGMVPIVCYDGKIRPDYVPNNVECFPAHPYDRVNYFYNLHCNDLLDYVSQKDGYFFFLDDDDVIYQPNRFARFLRHLNPNKATICQFIRKTRIKPSNSEIRNGQIISGRIGMPCIFLHTSQALLCRFNDKSNADYEYIAEVVSKIGAIFVPIVVVLSPYRSHGK